MKLQPKITIEAHFSELKDPRIERSKRHKLIDIITITAMFSELDRINQSHYFRRNSSN